MAFFINQQAVAKTYPTTAKPYCYNREDAQKIFECLRLKEEYEKSTMDLGKYEVKQVEVSFFDTEYGKAVIFLLGVGVGFTASELAKR